MKTKNGRAVKTSGGTVYVREVKSRERARNKWHDCGTAAAYGRGYRWLAFATRRIDEVPDWSVNYPTRKLAAIACAEAYEAEVLDKPSDPDGAQLSEWDGERDEILTNFPVTMEKQDDERDAEAYVDTLQLDVGSLEAEMAHDAFLEGRKSAR